MGMSISFLFPEALYLLLLLVPLWAMARAVRQQRAAQGLWVSLGIRSALIVALVLALAGTRIDQKATNLTTVFLIDRSASIDPAMRERADTFVRDALAAMPQGDRAAVVAFGADAVVERAPGQDTRLNASQVFTNTATNIQDAIQLGMALLPAETGKRLVLLSDGGENAGNAQAATQLAASRRIPLSYVDLAQQETTPEAQLSELQVPSNIFDGQSVTLTAVIESTVAQSAVLRIAGDGKLIAEQPVALQAGTNRVQINAGVPPPGLRRYRARIIPTQDTRAENNVAESAARVDGPPRVLLVEGQKGAGANLKRALAAAKMTADVVAPQSIPQNLTNLSAFDAVILLNVPAKALSPAVQKNLPIYVHDLGKGLLMFGGRQSFGIGGYGNTPIEQALPVSMDVRKIETRPNLAIVYVLDKSSSMQACHCRGPDRAKDGYYDKTGRTKLEIGKDAVVRSVAVLNPQDVVGVVAFDGSVHWAFEPVAQAKPNDVLNAIAPLMPNGHETNVGVGLRAAEDALAKTDATIKHVVLMTDGWSEGEDPLKVINDMRNQGITVSIVAEGVGSSPNLQALANAGGGRYFPVNNMEDALQIFVQETRQVSENFIVEHPFTPQYGSRSPILAGLDTGLPKLYGYNGTTAKQTATVALSDADGAPVLAQWQYGLGRSVAWTSDASGRWAKDWLQWQQFPRFAAQMASWTLSSRSGPNAVQVETDASGQGTLLQVTVPPALVGKQDAVAVQARIIGQDGTPRDVPLVAQAPGEYRATVDTPPQGSYVVQVAGSHNGQVVFQGTGSLVVPYSAEFRMRQANPALLDALARATGGAQLANPQQAFAPVSEQLPVRPRDITMPLMLLALLLLPVDILARRLIVLWRTRAR